MLYESLLLILSEVCGPKEKFSFSFFFFFLRAAPAAYGVPRLGVESELQLPAYTTATTTSDKLSLQPTPQLTATSDA